MLHKLTVISRFVCITYALGFSSCGTRPPRHDGNVIVGANEVTQASSEDAIGQPVITHGSTLEDAEIIERARRALVAYAGPGVFHPRGVVRRPAVSDGGWLVFFDLDGAAFCREKMVFVPDDGSPARVIP